MKFKFCSDLTICNAEPQMVVTEVEVETQTEQVQMFVDFALKYQGDITHEYDSPEDLKIWLTKKYIEYPEELELVLRPKFFRSYGGDCDNQLVYLIAYYAKIGKFRDGQVADMSNLRVMVEKDYNGEYVHIFAIDTLLNVSYDALPVRPYRECRYGCQQYRL